MKGVKYLCLIMKEGLIIESKNRHQIINGCLMWLEVWDLLETKL